MRLRENMGLSKVANFLKRQFIQGTEIDNNNIFAAVVIGGSSHSFHYFMHKYIFHLNESIWVRVVATFLCLTVGLYSRLPTKIQKNYFPFYWHAMLIVALPMSISYMMLINHFANMWLFWMIFMPIALSIFIPNWLTLLFDLFIGLLASLLIYHVEYGNLIFVSSFEPAPFFTIFTFSAITGIIFVYGNRKAWLNKQKDQYTKLISLTGSIVHEIRNPLNAISLSATGVKEILNSEVNLKSVESLSSNLEQKSKSSELVELNNSVIKSVTQANEIINIILSDLKNKPIELDEFCYLDVQKILPQIIASYGYRNLAEKEKVQLNISSSFIFKAVPDRFDFIIYNLLKNALYYLNKFPNSTVSIFTEKRMFEDQEFNALCVYDTGPGISAEILPKLFGEFFTSGKKEGTGLGLAFCKKNMIAFGGDIICESQLATEDESGVKSGGWTKFSLLFPKISDEELKRAQAELANLNSDGKQLENGDDQKADLNPRKYKVLIVDDEKTNLLVTKSKIQKCLPGVSCDIALGGLESIEMFEKNAYDLILMDIQMPEYDGIYATKSIREIIKKKSKSVKNYEQSFAERELPIIAFTSLDYKTFSQLAKQGGAEFSSYVNKSSSNNASCRCVAKWLFGFKDNFVYLANIAEHLKNKKALLVDDQEINRKLTKKVLEKYGMKVVEASDGNELIELYKKSLSEDQDHLRNQQKISDFNIILTDINMPEMTGDEATKIIRKIEEESGVKYQNRIPIIALSGNGNTKDILSFLKAQMTDYFIKGDDPSNLVNIIGNYVKDDEAKKEVVCEEDHQVKNTECIELSNVSEVKLEKKESEEKIEQKELQNLENKTPSDFKVFNHSKIDFLEPYEQKEIIDLYVRDSLRNLAKIKQDYQDNNFAQASLHVHAIKGISSNIGGEKFVNFIRTIEPSLRNKQVPQNPNWLQEFETLYHELVSALKNFVK